MPTTNIHIGEGKTLNPGCTVVLYVLFKPPLTPASAEAMAEAINNATGQNAGAQSSSWFSTDEWLWNVDYGEGTIVVFITPLAPVAADDVIYPLAPFHPTNAIISVPEDCSNLAKTVTGVDKATDLPNKLGEAITDTATSIVETPGTIASVIRWLPWVAAGVGGYMLWKWSRKGGSSPRRSPSRRRK